MKRAARGLARDMADTFVIGAAVIGTLQRECWNRGIEITDKNESRMMHELRDVLTDEFAGGPKRKPRDARDFDCPGKSPEPNNPYPLCDNNACPYADYCCLSAAMKDSRFYPEHQQ